MSTKGTNEDLMLECAREAVAKSELDGEFPDTKIADDIRCGRYDNSYAVCKALSGIKEYASRVDPIMEQMRDALKEADGAIHALKSGQFQIDVDGVSIGVSRQALDEVLIAIDKLNAALLAAKKETKS